MSDFFTQKKVIVPGLLIIAMLSFIVLRLAICSDRFDAGLSVLDYAYADESDETAVTAETIGVHITGAVNNPGFFEVPRGSRIYQVIEIAGGAAENAYFGVSVNLAERVHDEMQIFVPRYGEMIPDGSGRRRINLNTANATELQTLPGIGESRARDIIERRTQMGGFRRAEDLMTVRGIGQATFERLLDYIIVPPR